jgi:hypothetical protein
VKLLLVMYDVPEKPSRLKVSAWRKLKRLGGVYPKLSLCILPDTPEVRSALSEVLGDLREVGVAIAMEAEPISESDSSIALSILKAAKEREYREIAEECHEFLEEVEANIKGDNVTQEEAEELSEAFDSLKEWYERVRRTDWVGAEAGNEVEDLLRKCEKALEEFISLVLQE